MQALQNRLEKLENATGSEMWEILKTSESELRQDLSQLNLLKEDKEEHIRKALTEIKSKKEELKKAKADIELLRDEYSKHIEQVQRCLSENGLDMKQVTGLFQKILDDSLSEKKSQIVSTISSICFTSTTTYTELREPIKSIISILAENDEELRRSVQNPVDEFHEEAVQVFRSNLWSLFGKYKIPIENSKFEVFPPEIVEIFEFSTDLDLLSTGNHQKSVENLIHAAFGHVSNLCIDMIESEEEEGERDADFEWILTSAQKWAGHLKEVVEKGVAGMSTLDGGEKRKVGGVYDEKFGEFVGTITKRFLRKHIKDPLVFSKLAVLLRRFEETSDFDLSNRDLFEPFYEPEFISRWMLLEVELFTISINRLLGSAHCFQPLSAISLSSASSNNSNLWASEITVFFEQWIQRLDKNIQSFGNLEVQTTFYECIHALMIDLCAKIRAEANRLYSEPSWSNDVYLVMNSVWELKRIIQTLTMTWPISSFEVERVYEREWSRLSGMIGEYLMDLVDGMDKGLRSSYAAEKKKWMGETFHHISKCLKNVTVKASRPSRGPLLNALTEELFKSLQAGFEQKWKHVCSVEMLAFFYTQIYSSLLPQLDEFQREGHWTRGHASRSEQCRLDALMKVSANADPSGELVRTAFRSIDEEQVLKMLAELGIHSTSDHAFQDYQILAENWSRIEEKGLADQ